MKSFYEHYRLLNHAEKSKLAQELGTSLAYLSQLANGHRRPGWKILTVISQVTEGEVSAESFGQFKRKDQAA